MINFFSGKRYFIFLLLLTVFSVSRGQVFDIVVDQNGSGDYTTVQAAINSVENYLDTKTLIFIKKGIYYEKVVVSSSKNNISLIGEDPLTTIITYDDNPTKDGLSSADTYTFWSDSPGLYAENLTFENSSGAVGQALAIKTTGDTMVFKNCRFLGFQDTYYAHKNRQYNLGCYIEGATDFVYGDATTVFDYCTLNCVKGGSYITAPADAKILSYPYSTGRFIHGLLFRFCDITADADVPDHSYYLGRPWQEYASSVYIQCKLGDHINQAGWSTWGNTNHKTSYFGEYKDMNADSSLADISQRVDWSYQVPDSAREFYDLDYFLKKSSRDKWDPVPVTEALSAPTNLSASSTEINWDAVQDAKGYLVFKDDSLIAITESTAYVDPDFADAAEYSAKSVSANGNLSRSSNDVNTAVNVLKENQSNLILGFANRVLQFSQEVQYEIFTISGVLIYSGEGSFANLSSLSHGIYIVRAVNSQKIVETQKFSF